MSGSVLSGQIDEIAIRRALSEFATGVTIVATTEGGERVGFACQSFSSLSLEPPMVLFTVMKTSRSWPRIEKSGTFSVNVLSEEQQEYSIVFGRRSVNKFEYGSWSESPLGNPILEDCAVWIDCTVADVHEGGDHWIVTGDIKSIGHRGDRKPLLYHRGSYSRAVASGEDAPVEQQWRQRPSV